MTEFKVGDKVKLKNGGAFLGGKKIEEVTRITETNFGTQVWLTNTTWLRPALLVHAPTPRKHAELIKQWADDDSLEVQWRHYENWLSTTDPRWFPDFCYRIKPKEKTEKERLTQELKEVEQRVTEIRENLERLG